MSLQYYSMNSLCTRAQVQQTQMVGRDALIDQIRYTLCQCVRDCSTWLMLEQFVVLTIVGCSTIGCTCSVIPDGPDKREANTNTYTSVSWAYAASG